MDSLQLGDKSEDLSLKWREWMPVLFRLLESRWCAKPLDFERLATVCCSENGQWRAHSQRKAMGLEGVLKWETKGIEVDYEAQP